jgi:uncharacterized protein
MSLTGETDLQKILQSLKPKLNSGEYVFCAVHDLSQVSLADVIMFFTEEKAITVILKKELADQLKLSYPAVMSWITLTVHSALTAVGLTSAFSKALAEQGISCNVVAAFYHDHIFVEQKDAELAMHTLNQISVLAK